MLKCENNQEVLIIYPNRTEVKKISIVLEFYVIIQGELYERQTGDQLTNNTVGMIDSFFVPITNDIDDSIKQKINDKKLKLWKGKNIKGILNQNDFKF